MTACPLMDSSASRRLASRTSLTASLRFSRASSSEAPCAEILDPGSLFGSEQAQLLDRAGVRVDPHRGHVLRGELHQARSALLPTIAENRLGRRVWKSTLASSRSGALKGRRRRTSHVPIGPPRLWRALHRDTAGRARGSAITNDPQLSSSDDRFSALGFGGCSQVQQRPLALGNYRCKLPSAGPNNLLAEQVIRQMLINAG
jgi:hypothetical protein